jgi:hypothetical protein
MARNPVDDLANALKDATFVSVGLGVIAFQRLQVRRQELQKAFDGTAEEARGNLEMLASLVGERVKAVEERLGAARGR